MKQPQDLRSFESLQQILHMLRSPEGCPWDRAQTHKSMRDSLLEETYEVLEALDAEDTGRFCGELGDLLLQIVFHAEIGAEAKEFNMGDVIEAINTKLIRRHPHVFSQSKFTSPAEVLHNWEEIKKTERGHDKSMLSGVPKQLPALSYSQEVQGRVARVGFDWKEDEGVLEKLGEEIAEYGSAPTLSEKEKEFGDILFTLANYARRQGIDLESALRGANKRFYSRFEHMEELCRNTGKDISKLSFGEQNELWQAAKKKENGEKAD
ncbi:MAG: nucleoside triphosphate pyrophosphohydrolase [Dehalococcoides mccartyi]|uniref:nucleoside triphosphate pyrophosphohydrolase n=1 Tax=Dehalococcoides mccartyi TaxID=61435 RepID=UPI0019E718A9|nr:nucleoside triphosphate pyrophosphohydrolase [Dehalococcoides mccartyi]MBF4482403.1 nucleoside triphosphate pyrophosphohydrolase [Dehalococcoides mccartyi]MBJ7531633.1 nucleoside triphosphate pyrophosphohydrolase [Dehalococcoides mccartyi]